MHLSITHASQFADQFHKVGRGSQFSYDALRMLFNWLEDVQPDYELDVIAICCEFAESTVDELLDSYNIPLDEENEDVEAQVIQYLVDECVFVGRTFEGTIVYQQF